jgi:hypothetical protein
MPKRGAKLFARALGALAKVILTEEYYPSDISAIAISD